MYKTSLEATAALVRSDHMSAEYLAEAGANHAVWRLLNERGFPARSDVYYMHDLGNGRYGYKVRPHTDTTFATIAAVGATSRNVVKQNYVVYVKRQMASLWDASFVLSTQSSAVLGGLSFLRMDLVDYTYDTDSATLFQDGMSLFLASKNVDAVSIMSEPPVLPGGIGDYPGAVNALGPIGYWRLGESSGTKASDETGSNDGTYVNSITLGRPGFIVGDSDTAAEFDESSQAHIVVGPSGDLPLNGNFSVAFWVNIDTLPWLTGTDMIFFFESSNNGDVMTTAELRVLYSSSRGDLVYTHQYGINGTLTESHTFSSTNLNDDTVYFLALTRDTTAQEVRVYVDGVLDDTFSYSNNPEGETDATLYMSDDSALEFDGVMDEFSVFDYALSVTEVEHLYNEGVGNIPVGGPGHIVLSTGVPAVIDTLSFDESDLVAYDPVAETAVMILDGSSVFSATENIDAVHLLDNGHILLSVSGSAVIGGLSFGREDIVEYDPVGLSATLYFDGSDHFSGSVNLNAVYVLADDQVVFSVSDTMATIGALTFSDEDLVVYDPVSGTTRMYFDGGVPFGDLDEDITGLHVTSENYSYVINRLEPVGYWRLGDASGTTAVDETGNNDGTYTSGVSFGVIGAIAGDPDTAVGFDGANDEFDIGPSGLIPLNGDISVTFWLNIDTLPTSGNGDNVLAIESTNSAWGMNTLEFRVNNSGDLYYRHQYDTWGGSEETFSFDSADLAIDTWYNLTLTRDATSRELDLYIDGVFVETFSYANSPEGETAPMLVVARQSGGRFDGFMDELAVFDYVLSDVEALLIYNAGV